MLSFDDFPIVYCALGYLLAGAIVVLTLLKNKNFQEILFLGLSAALLLFMRLPVVIFNQEINPDESQMLAHAITLKQYPIYWQSVDGTTIGPLDNYALLLPSFFGRAIDYTSGRLVGLLCVLGSLWFFYRSVKNWWGENTARVALLPPLFLLTFTQEADYVHYSSEQLPVLILNIGLWLLSKNWNPSPKIAPWFLLGLVLGMSPFAKIQVVPQAAVIGLFAIIQGWNTEKRMTKLSALVLGAVTFPILTLVWAWTYDVLDDFWNFYVLGNLIYAGGSSLIDSILRLPHFFANSPSFMAFLLTALPLVLLAFKGGKNKTTLFYFAVLWLLTALYAATKSGNDFVHYLNLCIYPFGLMAALGINTLVTQSKTRVALAILIVGVWVGWFGYKVLKREPLNAYLSTADHRVPVSQVSKLIQQYASSNDRLVIWGWMCRYHVETQMPQGTAENHSERCIYPHPMREIYYKRYLADLKQNAPKVFVDAVGPNSLWLYDRSTQAHEAFPELKALVDAHYRLVGEVENTRVFVRTE